MNRLILGTIAVALMSSGCVVRTAAPPVVVAQPPVVVAQPPVVVYPPVIPAPPAVVLVPGTRVYTVPGASFNVFVYGGRYYSYHHGTWFHAPRHGAAWSVAALHAVPAPVRAVPVKHYKIPPGHERHDGKHQRVERDDRDDRADRDGPRCPPGRAKKGDC